MCFTEYHPWYRVLSRALHTLIRTFEETYEAPADRRPLLEAPVLCYRDG